MESTLSVLGSSLETSLDPGVESVVSGLESTLVGGSVESVLSSVDSGLESTLVGESVESVLSSLDSDDSVMSSGSQRQVCLQNHVTKRCNAIDGRFNARFEFGPSADNALHPHL